MGNGQGQLEVLDLETRRFSGAIKGLAGEELGAACMLVMGSSWRGIGMSLKQTFCANSAAFRLWPGRFRPRAGGAPWRRGAGIGVPGPLPAPAQLRHPAAAGQGVLQDAAHRLARVCTLLLRLSLGY